MPNEKSFIVDLGKENALVPILPRPPLVSSYNSNWQSIRLEYHRQPATETPEHFFPQHMICINLGSQFKSERLLNESFFNDELVDGDILIAPAQSRYKTSWQKDIEFLVIVVDPQLIARQASEMLDADNFELIPYLKTRDPLIQGIG